MNTSTHPVSHEDVMAFLDGELDGQGHDLVCQHVEGCEECRATKARLREVSRELANWQVEAVPAKVEEKVRHALNMGLRHDAKPVAWFPWRTPLWVRCAVGVAFAVIVILVLGQPNAMRMGNSLPQKSVGPFVSKLPMSSARPPALHSNGSALPLDISPYPPPADSNGLFHGLAGRAEQSISVDGQPRTDEQRKVNSGPMIARTASLSIVVKDFAVGRTTLDAILARHHAYAAEMTVNTAEGAPRTLQASLRIPAAELAVAMGELKALGRVENENQSGEEVTQQHADLMARLKNTRETEQRLQSILQERTGKISDVLEVEQEIARVRGQIEQMEAEQKSLEHRVDFATVNLSLADVYQAQLAIPSLSIRTRLHNGVIAGLHNATETVLGFVLFCAEYGLALLIWSLILGLPVLLLRRRYRRSLETVS
jgi:hypothetical protein